MKLLGDTDPRSDPHRAASISSLVPVFPLLPPTAITLPLQLLADHPSDMPQGGVRVPDPHQVQPRRRVRDLSLDHRHHGPAPRGVGQEVVPVEPRPSSATNAEGTPGNFPESVQTASTGGRSAAGPTGVPPVASTISWYAIGVMLRSGIPL